MVVPGLVISIVDETTGGRARRYGNPLCPLSSKPGEVNRRNERSQSVNLLQIYNEIKERKKYTIFENCAVEALGCNSFPETTDKVLAVDVIGYKQQQQPSLCCSSKQQQQPSLCCSNKQQQQPSLCCSSKQQQQPSLCCSNKQQQQPSLCCSSKQQQQPSLCCSNKQQQQPSLCCSNKQQQQPSLCCSSKQQQQPSLCCSNKQQQQPSLCCSSKQQQQPSLCCSNKQQQQPSLCCSSKQQQQPSLCCSNKQQQQPSLCCSKPDTMMSSSNFKYYRNENKYNRNENIKQAETTEKLKGKQWRGTAVLIITVKCEVRKQIVFVSVFSEMLRYIQGRRDRNRNDIMVETISGIPWGVSRLSQENEKHASRDTQVVEINTAREHASEVMAGEHESEVMAGEHESEVMAGEHESENTVREHESEVTARENTAREHESQVKACEQESENTVCKQESENTACEQESKNTACEQESENTVCEQESENTVREQESENTVCEQESENTVREQESENTVREQESENTVCEQESENTVCEQESENTVCEQESENTVREQESENTVCEQESENTVREQESENTVREQESENTVREQESENTVCEQESENTVREQESENTVREQESENTVREQESENTVREQESENTACEQESENTACEQESENTACEQESENTVREQESENTACEQESENTVREQESENTACEQESENTACEQESENTACEQESENTVREQESENTACEQESENTVREQESENTVREQESENTACEQESENTVREQESENTVREQESENTACEQESENTVREQESENTVREQESENTACEQESENTACEQESENTVREQESENTALELYSQSEIGSQILYFSIKCNSDYLSACIKSYLKSNFKTYLTSSCLRTSRCGIRLSPCDHPSLKMETANAQRLVICEPRQWHTATNCICQGYNQLHRRTVPCLTSLWPASQNQPTRKDLPGTRGHKHGGHHLPAICLKYSTQTYVCCLFLSEVSYFFPTASYQCESKPDHKSSEELNTNRNQDNSHKSPEELNTNRDQNNSHKSPRRLSSLLVSGNTVGRTLQSQQQTTKATEYQWYLLKRKAARNSVGNEDLGKKVVGDKFLVASSAAKHSDANSDDALNILTSLTLHKSRSERDEDAFRSKELSFMCDPAGVHPSIAHRTLNVNMLPSAAHGNVNMLPSAAHGNVNMLPSAAHGNVNMLPSAAHGNVNMLPSAAHGIRWALFEKETMRLASFALYPASAVQSAAMLAGSGFVYIGDGVSDRVKCFFCSAEKESWQEADNIDQVHMALSPTCPMVIVQTTNNVASNNSTRNLGSITNYSSAVPCFEATALSGHASQDNRPTSGGQAVGNTAHGSRSASIRGETMSSSNNEMRSNAHERPERRSADRRDSAVSSGSESSASGRAQVRASHASSRRSQGADHTDSRSARDGNTAASRQDSSQGAPNLDISSSRHQAHQPGNPAESVPTHQNINSQIYSIPTGASNTPAPDTPARSSSPPSAPGSTPAASNLDPQLTYQLLGIFHERPKHIQYAVLSRRLQTFEGWPEGHPLKKDDLAKSGLFYAGYGDCCRCFSCGGGLRNWEDNDDPRVEHARWFPKCSFLRQHVGDDFVKAVQALAGSRDCIRLEDVTEHMKRAGQAEYINEGSITEDAAVKSVIQAGYDSDIVERMAKNIRDSGELLSADGILQALSEAGVKSSTGAVAGGEDLDSRGTLPDEERLQTLKEQNYALRNNLICKICMDKEVRVVFLPCGHLVCCQECAAALLDCPLCRRHIRATTMAYISK